ncbi:MAG TPA: arylamine N-acetyltransferase [Phenylobacterium sp.]|jgi:N-hydroxyarylamine O-acetyltransferase|uniref:arylamine N-acetyltransferase family protein n=1 Tax=Phenylobacterium sp. TaxID=1871053 RepID=UPI002BFA54BB|nr:arylamine N-acetyltransferase [Phenylobacterium sp.]HXA39793.1 arylamine N-acetyltransferase [Phenylobacterium sp.]
MELAAYLERIGFSGQARPDLATLRALHRAHLAAIPYENLDVQLGRRVTPDPAAAFDKLVTRRRGGWCYEMNGVLGAALGAIGFKVTRLAGGVMRAVAGDSATGNHLVLLVDVAGQPWIADVGLGGGTLEPYRLAAGPVSISGYDFRLEGADDGWWRFHNHPNFGAPSFDFRLAPADPAMLAAKCDWLQSAPESIFVQHLIVHRFRREEALQIVDRTLHRVTPDRVEKTVMQSADELVAVLAADFGLDLPETAALWPSLLDRHERAMAADAEA